MVERTNQPRHSLYGAVIKFMFQLKTSNPKAETQNSEFRTRLKTNRDGATKKRD